MFLFEITLFFACFEDMNYATCKLQATLTQYGILKIIGYIILVQHVVGCLWFRDRSSGWAILMGVKCSFT